MSAHDDSAAVLKFPRLAARRPLAQPACAAAEPGMEAVLAADKSRGLLLHEFFEAQADAHPDRTALVCGGVQITYAGLERAANQLARRLRAGGVGHGDCVAFQLPRSLDVPIALLAILKTGAAYVPLDFEWPRDRVAYILADCHVHTFITVDDHTAGGVACHVHRLEPAAGRASSASRPAERLTRAESGATPDDPCYVIYTSGSTGRPKGVEILHRNACNLVLAERDLFGVQPDDRVFQGFSPAFDASVEEFWLAFATGAALVIGTSEIVHSGPGLSRWLEEQRVSVLSCVPTLLSMMDGDATSVRLLIVGGEQCPIDLVRRWCRPGRRMFNTYGPTEATVIATCTECDPARPVTIGRPIANYSVHILDEALQPVAPGEAGELHIGGAGLARGYVGLPELTRQKFIENVLLPGGGFAPRLYKTGDLARFTEAGDIDFLGRIDAQVKLRGFRIELTEIEAALAEQPGVLAAAVALREDVPGVQYLVGYIVPRSDANPPSDDELKAALRQRLPAYMVPAVIDAIEELPRLTSGKLDRKALPAPRPREAPAGAGVTLPRTDIERALAAIWNELFAPTPVSIGDNFFLDLGGHSLLAARMVSAMRRDPRFERLSMLDLYNFPTIAALAQRLEEAPAKAVAAAAKAAVVDTAAVVHRPSSRAHYFCGLMQLGTLYFVLGLFSLQWLAPYLTYSWMIDDEYPVIEAVLGSLASLIVVYPVMLVASIVVKWTVIGRYKPGDYPLWGAYYFRWWLVNAFQSVVPVSYLAGTPLLNWYYRVMGAHIGSNVYLGSDNASVFDLLSIGDDSAVGVDSSLACHTVENGWLRLGTVRIGRRCIVGSRCVVRENAVLEDGAQLDDLSLLPRGGRVGLGQRWAGAPARLAPGASHAAPSAFPRPSRLRRCIYGGLYVLGVLAVPIFVLAAIFPGMMVMSHLNAHDDYYWYLALSPVVAVSFVSLLCLEIALIKWLLLGRVKPGRYPLFSGFVARKWFVDKLMELSLDVVGTLYATLYLAPWYRLLGARLGRRTEISTASFISPDLLELGDEAFIADAVSLGAARVERGGVSIAPVRVGKRTFIGNSALLPPGADIGDNCLIGCLSSPPAADEARRPGSAWLGSPAFHLPQRQQSAPFAEDCTYRPARKLWWQRAAMEFVRITLPSTCFIMLTSVLLSVLVMLRGETYPAVIVAAFPVLYAAFGCAAALIVIVLKWTLMGRYRPGERPLWSPFVWRTELVTAMHDNLAHVFLTGMLAGTPFLAWYLRLLGAKIGRRVYLASDELTEFDLVQIGDDACINHDATLQTHLFEDRVMKMGPVEVGAGCNVGSLSLVLYGARMEPGSTLGDLSLLMKGEVLPAHSRWEGIPAQRAPATGG